LKALLHRFFFACAVGAGFALAACSSQSIGTPIPATAVSIKYTAIGASDAVGYGASVPCANPPTVANPTCPGGTGYVPDLVKLLTNGSTTVTLNDLGISGAVLGPDILATVNAYGPLGSADQCAPRTQGVDAYPADFITNELPNLTGTETLVTIFAGGNDTNGIANAAACLSAGGATTAQVSSFITTEIGAFSADLNTLLTKVRAKAPNAKIVIANLPNFSQIPIGLAQSAGAQQLLATISVGIDTAVIDPLATSGVPVVDLLCNPQSYVPANFYTDGFHPDDAGYAIFAQAFDSQITATTPAAPSTTCSYVAANAKLRTAPTSALPDFSRPAH
jgi:lysophospholipase L1-like esterase